MRRERERGCVVEGMREGREVGKRLSTGKRDEEPSETVTAWGY